MRGRCARFSAAAVSRRRSTFSTRASATPAGAALGLASHYAILFVAAALYLAASRRVLALRARPIACGALFGVLVYLFMNFVVLPMSAFPFHLSYPPMRLLEGFASHAVFVGASIALSVCWLADAPRNPAELAVN